MIASNKLHKSFSLLSNEIKSKVYCRPMYNYIIIKKICLLYIMLLNESFHYYVVVRIANMVYLLENNRLFELHNLKLTKILKL